VETPLDVHSSSPPSSSTTYFIVRQMDAIPAGNPTIYVLATRPRSLPLSTIIITLAIPDCCNFTIVFFFSFFSSPLPIPT
jgi:hypothetical protein